MPEALAAAEKIKGGPVVLAESSDSTGSGSPGDSTGVSEAPGEGHLSGPAAIFLVDPHAVAKAVASGCRRHTCKHVHRRRIRQEELEAGAGDGYVRLISDGRWTARARGYNTGITTSMGRARFWKSARFRS